MIPYVWLIVLFPLVGVIINGLIGGDRNRLHQRIHESIADLAAFAKPTLTVLDAYRILKGAKHVYYLQTRYLATAEVGFVDIEPGQSLTIVADGETIKFYSASGSMNNRELVRGMKFAEEKALFEVTRDQLQKIAKAKKVKVQIKGAKGLIERDFGPKNYDDFRAFVTRFAL